MGELSEEEQLAIIRHRLPKHDNLVEFLYSDDAAELLGPDANTVEKMKERGDQEAPVVLDFKTAAKDLAKKVAESVNVGKVGKGRGKGKCGGRGEPPAKKPRKYPPTLDMKSGLSIDLLNTFLPSQCKFGIDWLDGYWRLAAYGTLYGRSWRRHGEEEGAKQLIKKAWEVAIERGYEVECPFAELRLT